MKNTQFVDELIAQEKVSAHLGHVGKLIAGSKSGYRDRNPSNLVVFNGNICVEFLDKGKYMGFIPYETTNIRKVWWGDIDISLSRESLKSAARDLGMTIYVLTEMDARFNNELNPRWQNYYIKITPDGEEFIGERIQNYVRIDDEVLELLPSTKN